MKFIITESSMSRVVSLYLNNKKFDMIDSEKKFDSYAYFFEKGKDKKNMEFQKLPFIKKTDLVKQEIGFILMKILLKKYALFLQYQKKIPLK